MVEYEWWQVTIIAICCLAGSLIMYIIDNRKLHRALLDNPDFVYSYIVSGDCPVCYDKVMKITDKYYVCSHCGSEFTCDDKLAKAKILKETI